MKTVNEKQVTQAKKMTGSSDTVNDVQSDSVQTNDVQLNSDETVSPPESMEVIPPIVQTGIAPRLTVSGRKYTLESLQARLQALGSVGGQVKKLASENEARIEAYIQQAGLDRAAKREVATGKRYEAKAGKVKSECDGRLIAFIGITKLRAMLALKLITASEFDKVQRLMAFSESLGNLFLV